MAKLGYGGLANTNIGGDYSGKTEASGDDYDLRLRDGTYRRRFGWGLAVILFLLFA